SLKYMVLRSTPGARAPSTSCAAGPWSASRLRSSCNVSDTSRPLDCSDGQKGGGIWNGSRKWGDHRNGGGRKGHVQPPVSASELTGKAILTKIQPNQPNQTNRTEA
ncbi:hypothetical protein Vafri_554, partial [Volvox africanus]